jgi:hypothetical protein
MACPSRKSPIEVLSLDAIVCPEAAASLARFHPTFVVSTYLDVSEPPMVGLNRVAACLNVALVGLLITPARLLVEVPFRRLIPCYVVLCAIELAYKARPSDTQ